MPLSIHLYYKHGVSLHTVLKTANLKSCQQCLLSKMPNIMFANYFAYMVFSNWSTIIPHDENSGPLGELVCFVSRN